LTTLREKLKKNNNAIYTTTTSREDKIHKLVSFYKAMHIQQHQRKTKYKKWYLFIYCVIWWSVISPHFCKKEVIKKCCKMSHSIKGQKFK
jgi:hypothetical protein